MIVYRLCMHVFLFSAFSLWSQFHIFDSVLLVLIKPLHSQLWSLKELNQFADRTRAALSFVFDCFQWALRNIDTHSRSTELPLLSHWASGDKKNKWRRAYWTKRSCFRPHIVKRYSANFKALNLLLFWFMKALQSSEAWIFLLQFFRQLKTFRCLRSFFEIVLLW